MKTSIFIIALAWILFLACERLGGDPVRRYLPGTYVRTFEHAFAKGSDTLEIEQSESDQYAIVKRSAFRRLKDGVWLPAEHRKENWSGVYHPARGVVEETQRGKVLRVVPKKNQLLVGTSVYLKIK